MIRKARLSDAKAAYDIYFNTRVNPYMLFEKMGRATFRKYWGGMVRREGLHVYEKNKTLVGFYNITRYSGRTSHVALLSTFAIHPAYWGIGIGTEIVKKLKKDLKKKGVRRLELWAESDNPRAIRFYKRRGFKKEGTLKRFYQRRGGYINEYIMAVLL